MKHRSLIRGVLITIMAFAAILTLLIIGLSQINARSETQQAASLKEAVLRAAVTCYAVEGRYPTDVEYLQANYGLTYNHDNFIVSIHAFADNLLPDIAVLAKGEN